MCMTIEDGGGGFGASWYSSSQISHCFDRDAATRVRPDGRIRIRVFRDLLTAPFDGIYKIHSTLGEIKINSGERTFQDIDDV